MDLQEMNEQSGSRGEANFVWKCKNCKVHRLDSYGSSRVSNAEGDLQRESTATIKTAPATYERTEPAKAKNIIEIDCRGLEFIDFKPDVSLQSLRTMRTSS